MFYSSVKGASVANHFRSSGQDDEANVLRASEEDYSINDSTSPAIQDDIDELPLTQTPAAEGVEDDEELSLIHI